MDRDIILNDTGDLAIQNGDFVLSNSLTQEVGLILQLKQGELKSDVLLGANLVSKLRSVGGKAAAIVKAKIHLKRDNKEYNDMKNKININGSEM